MPKESTLYNDIKITTREAARLEGLTERHVQRKCREGKYKYHWTTLNF